MIASHVKTSKHNVEYTKYKKACYIWFVFMLVILTPALRNIRLYSLLKGGLETLGCIVC